MNEHSILITALFLYAVAALAYFVRMVRAGNILIVLGIILNTVGLVMKGCVGETWYFALMVDEIRALPLFIALLVLVFFRTRAETPGRILTVALVLCSLVAFIPIPVQELPSVKTQVLVAPVFFLLETISIALFIAGGFLAMAAIIFACDTDTAMRQCVLWGFVVFTVCQVLGAVWAFVGWSFPFSWSPRHLASASTWCLYAALLHAGYVRIPQRLITICAALGLVPIAFIVFHHEISRLLLNLAGVTS